MNWTVADYLQASSVCLTAMSILVTAFMAWWVVKSVQRKLDTERTLKDHFAHEVIDLRKETRDFITKVINGGMKAKDIKYNHYHLRAHIRDLQNVLFQKYKINKTLLKAYKMNMFNIIEKDSEYENAFKENLPVSLCSETIFALHKLGQDNDHLFNEILLKIYE
ncbi:MAG: hypothetical protein IKK62_07325 [Bacteroidaceae bacterium]|nr:hypothetical protein [Bacteroidaceae bacterium]